jgi:leader peptidase (prepilin peptidase)/N-methyltransferase
MGVAVAELVLRSLPPATPVLHAGAVFASYFALALALLCAAFIDAEHMFLPDAITIGGTVFGVATAGLRDLTWPDTLFGAAAGFLGVWLPLVIGYRLVRGRPGMGLGDAKLVMLAGGWFGWRGAAFALFAGAAQATVAAVVMTLVHGRIEEPEAVRADREMLVQAAAAGDADAIEALDGDPLAEPPGEGFLSSRIPFGPFLCLAIIEWMLAGRWALELPVFPHLP